jgi:hypothetical protein
MSTKQSLQEYSSFAITFWEFNLFFLSFQNEKNEKNLCHQRTHPHLLIPRTFSEMGFPECSAGVTT